VTAALRRVGLDDPGADFTAPREIAFTSTAAGEVRADATGTSGGQLKLCLIEGTVGQPVGLPICLDGETASVRALAVGGSTRWTVTLEALESGSTPVTNLTVRFPSNDRELDLDAFRFQGATAPDLNGFTVEVQAAAGGELRVEGRWTANGADATSDYRLTATDLTDPGATPFERRSTDSAVEVSIPAVAGHTYRVALSNAAEGVSQGISLDAALSWP
jgi:hypothetical protein